MSAFLGDLVWVLIIIGAVWAILARKRRRVVYTDQRPYQPQQCGSDRALLQQIADHETAARAAENEVWLLQSAGQHYLAANQMGISAQHRAAAAVLRGQMGGQR